MKTLLIVRHAKSSWDNADTSDIDRPLNDRGKRDAPAMAQRIIRTGLAIDRFVSSPAKRARQTAEYFVEAATPAAQVNVSRMMLDLWSGFSSR